MTNSSRASEIVGDLDAALRGPIGIRRAERVEELVATGKHARYMREPRLTLALHFDIAPAFVVYDPLLGTLGIVELIEPAAKRGEEVRRDVRRAIDRATYARHLVLRDRSREQLRPLTVELVFVTGDQNDAEKATLEDIGTALRTVLRDTDSLFHIGIGVLCHGGTAIKFDGRLRRAFPWLLTASRRWLVSPRANPDGPAAAAGRTLRRLKLTNYRLPGEREFDLADARVHLMHGANGSGKSSIAEALELVTCGKVERLAQAGATQYDAVIRNAASVAPATIQVGWTTGAENQIVDEPPRTVVANGLDDPLDNLVAVGSFRLDQPLMDRLAGHSAYDRARIFLEAFFPQAAASRSKFEQAAESHQASLAKLDAVIERLTTARQALEALQTHQTAVAKPTGEPFPVVLNQWLEQTALVDLLQRQRIIRTTLEAAQGSGWKAFDAGSTAAAAALASPVAIGDLERFEQDAKKAVEDLNAKLASFTSAATDIPAAEGTAPISRPIVEALNAVSPYLFDEDVLESFGRFGNKLAAVFNAGDAPTYGPIVVGSGNWPSR